MPTILIDVLPALGHLHATLKMATILKNSGYEVVYGSSSSLKSEINKYGFQFINLPDVSFVNVSLAEKAKRKNGFLVYLYWAIYQDRLNEKQKDILTFQKAVKKVNADIVFLDEQAALKTFIYEQENIKVATFQTKPDTRKIKGIPPFTSYYLPKFKFATAFVCNLIWGKKTLGYYFNNLNNQLWSVGQDNLSIVKKVARNYPVFSKSRLDFKRSFCIGVKGIHRLIISPAAFDFPHSEINNVHRIGPLVDVKRSGDSGQPRYKVLLNVLNEQKKKPDVFAVYCSLGTIKSKFKKVVTKFFKRIVQVARQNNNITFVLSTGENFDVEALFPVPDNLYIFDHVPQTDLLNYCDVMITHGGMNSITECIYADVPMLVYPLSPFWDQPGNSARIVYHKLGIRGKIGNDSAKNISQKLNALFVNYSYYQENVIAMKKLFEQNNNSDKWLKTVGEIINENK